MPEVLWALKASRRCAIFKPLRQKLQNAMDHLVTVHFSVEFVAHVLVVFVFFEGFGKRCALIEVFGSCLVANGLIFVA